MTDLYKIEFLLPSAESSGPMELVLEPFAAVVTCFETPGSDTWRLEAYCTELPPYDLVEKAISDGARIAGIPAPEFVAGPVPQIDWVSENQKSFTPIRAGRFFVYPSHFDGKVPAGSLSICMDAGMAFGTGEHGTTKGCLLMIEAVLKRRRVATALDLGCGTGILAIATALASKATQLTASDIDPDAVAVSIENCRINRLQTRVRPVVSDGLDRRELNRPGAYDLVIANILAGPLQRLAPGIARVVAPGGDVILSGLLEDQETAVLAAYRRQGLYLRGRKRLDGWSTLLLSRKA
ncbi:50S ribosomal protein L11 methyltransferase [Hwanghaeella grinnelliae]|uniref:Ribosomal protein L11 methyltransferase n=1 Tax=Hwanghaeella grinnelliae TaxID=2500179 RepID=A0A437QJE2_9PROT|nr:50S ribosomal protein L11 methyltransferase [Hwanghaeella grinnelliae]RVU34628.1 50S ribosomal protein L11 methyltransferase [Hwanghaeella grinnelliae]